MGSTGGGSRGIEEYTAWFTYISIESVNQYFSKSWDYLSSDSNNLNSLPANLQSSLNDFMNKLSLNGSLPTLPNQWGTKLSPPPPPPPPPTSIARQFIHKTSEGIQAHPYLTSFILTSTTLGSTYYFFPKTFIHHSTILLKPLRPYVPLLLLPTSDRPKRLNVNPTSQSTGTHQNEIRKEVALVLGAEEGLGREIALDLEKRGFVVIATVRLASQVEILEKKSRGWMKVLVLDPTESSSVSPFLRSLSTALSLRYPIHSSGDPFARPSHAISLTSVINCLSLPSSSHLESEGLCPLEAMDTERVKKYLGERVATIVGVLKGVLPIMRSMAGRPSAPEGVVISLMPSNTANFSLPFLALSSATDSAIVSLLHSLRRELNASKTHNLRSTILEVGFFDQVPSSSSSTSSLPTSPSAIDPTSSLNNLSPRLSTIYSSALSLHSPSPSLSSSPSTTLSTRSPSPLKSLTSQVFNILIYSRGSSLSRVGAGSTTYWIVGNFFPLNWSDGILRIRDGLKRGLRRFSGSAVGGLLSGGVEGGSVETLADTTTTTTTTNRSSVDSTSTQTQKDQDRDQLRNQTGYGPSSQVSLNSLNSDTTTTTSQPTFVQSQTLDSPFLFEEMVQENLNLLHSEISTPASLNAEEDDEDDDDDGMNSLEGSESGLGSFVGSEAGWRDDE